MLQVRRFTGSAALDTSVERGALGTYAKVREVRIHLASAPTASTAFTVSVDSGGGTEYNTVLATQDMAGLTDYVFRPNPPAPLAPGDKVHISYPNTDGITYGVEVWLEVM